MFWGPFITEKTSGELQKRNINICTINHFIKEKWERCIRGGQRLFVAVIKHHGQGKLEKKELACVYGPMVAKHKLRVHFLNCKQEAGRSNPECDWLWTTHTQVYTSFSKAMSPNPPHIKPPSEDQVFKHLVILGKFSLRPPRGIRDSSSIFAIQYLERHAYNFTGHFPFFLTTKLPLIAKHFIMISSVLPVGKSYNNFIKNG